MVTRKSEVSESYIVPKDYVHHRSPANDRVTEKLLQRSRCTNATEAKKWQMDQQLNKLLLQQGLCEGVFRS
jgi:hypothetical protein